MSFGTKTIYDFKKIWPNIEVAKVEVVNQDFEKGNIEYIEPGQDNYVYRCRACALGGFATHHFGKWRPLYYSGKYYNSTFKTHLDSCKGKSLYVSNHFMLTTGNASFLPSKIMCNAC